MDSVDNIEKCVICLKEFTTEMPKIQVREKGIQSLIKFNKIRKNEILKELLSVKSEESPVLVHKECRRDFTDIKRSLKTNTSTEENLTITITFKYRVMQLENSMLLLW